MMGCKRKEWVISRLMELSFKEDKDIVDVEEEKSLEQELKDIQSDSE